MYTKQNKNVNLVITGMEMHAFMPLVSAQLERSGISLVVRHLASVEMANTLDNLDNAGHSLRSVLLHINGMVRDARLLEIYVQKAHILNKITVFLTNLVKMVSFGIQHIFDAFAHQVHLIMVTDALSATMIKSGYLHSDVPALKEHSIMEQTANLQIQINVESFKMLFG